MEYCQIKMAVDKNLHCYKINLKYNTTVHDLKMKFQIENFGY